MFRGIPVGNKLITKRME